MGLRVAVPQICTPYAFFRSSSVNERVHIFWPSIWSHRASRVVERVGDAPGDLPRTHVVPVGLPHDMHMDALGDSVDCMLSYESSDASLSAMACPPPSAMMWDWAGEDEVDSELDLPMFLRHRQNGNARGATKKTAPRSSEDLLVELASGIQPDGGAPGDDGEKRIAASLLVLLLFHEAGHSASSGAFSAHVRRLRKFLAQAETSVLDGRRQVILEQALGLLAASKPVPGPWQRIAQDFFSNERWKPDGFWKAASHVALGGKNR